MPKLDIGPMEEAKVKTTSESASVRKRAQILQEYRGYIDQLKSGEAGRLVAGAGETTATVRRRIGAAARAAGLKLTIRRAGDEVYFWAVERRRATNGRQRSFLVAFSCSGRTPTGYTADETKGRPTVVS